jgi:hypothetical protein
VSGDDVTYNEQGSGGVICGGSAKVVYVQYPIPKPCCCATNFFPYKWGDPTHPGTVPIVIPETLTFSIPGIQTDQGGPGSCELLQNTMTAYPQGVTMGNTALIPGRTFYGATYTFQNPIQATAGYEGVIQILGTMLLNQFGTYWSATVTLPLGFQNIQYITHDWDWGSTSNVFPINSGQASHNCKNYPSSITVTSHGSIDCGCLTNGNWCGSFEMVVANDIFDSETGYKLVPKGIGSLVFTFGSGIGGAGGASCQCAWENGYCVWFGYPFGLVVGGSDKLAVPPNSPYTIVMLLDNGDGSATLKIGLAGPIIKANDGNTYQYFDGYGAPGAGQPHAYSDGSGQFTGGWTCTFQESLSFDIADFDCRCRYFYIPDAGIFLYT